MSRNPNKVRISEEFIMVLEWLHDNRLKWSDIGIQSNTFADWKRKVTDRRENTEANVRVGSLINVCNSLNYVGRDLRLPDDTLRKIEEYYDRHPPERPDRDSLNLPEDWKDGLSDNGYDLDQVHGSSETLKPSGQLSRSDPRATPNRQQRARKVVFMSAIMLVCICLIVMAKWNDSPNNSKKNIGKNAPSNDRREISGSIRPKGEETTLTDIEDQMNRCLRNCRWVAYDPVDFCAGGTRA